VHGRIAVRDLVNLHLAAKLAQGFNRKVDTLANIFGVRRIAGNRRRLNETLEQRFVFRAMVFGKGEELVAIKCVRHARGLRSFRSIGSSFDKLTAKAIWY